MLKANLNEMSKKIHENAVKHGWWETEVAFSEIIALCHSELSEALEEHRNGKPTDLIYYNGIAFNGNDKPFCLEDKPEGVPVELADCILRILDYCGRHNIDIDRAIEMKHEFNKSRDYRHGGKVV
ncbi:MAG TPA: hypothetical protein PKK26_18840 [Candidatus Wallbacteria bacterium]|nr:hypothetical protein [Candidatus Wallbacteria bacterium]